MPTHCQSSPHILVPSQEELLYHYKAVAAAVTIPIILYNIPKNTGINIAVETVAELAKVDNIIGIKDSSGNIDNIEGYIKATKNQKFAVLSGSDSLILKALKIGAKGAIAATANLLTKNDVAIYENFMNSRLEEAEQAQQQIEMLRSVLKLATVPSVLKKSLVLSNMPVGLCRFPVREPKAETMPKIKEMLTYYGL
ncbi:Dihydrodipicolinate synthase [Pelosinus fermentans DSM 17108]|uniref:Dihydrodipicolinate synthetase n=1 Tax=Pelosinus fermentans B4 TaxID=1149862 RepID=I8RNH0_9FIRM|nr:MULTISPECIES: dihydrodipicolinate synthase family protein [Pelosinus]EIW20630.1 dihydrodipicolinate synthetase [Pelosinus fermentans B4]EIW25655.1 dihydrodipicolinate synthetase [Pelosinus fermentans A11]MDF2570433.1 dapA4 [Sporomusa sp.]OAM93378.1 Dihydrodipicolinate synthase [Pelosinus fermentans DSM 17108]